MRKLKAEEIRRVSMPNEEETVRDKTEKGGKEKKELEISEVETSHA